MKPIPIVPIPHLQELSGGRDRYLALSHLAHRSPVYRSFMREQADRGAFITLDNSAHELGKGQNLRLLIEQAREIGAREVVIPDELFSYGGTLLKAEESYRDLSEFPELSEGLQFMIVPQGRNLRTVEKCLTRQVKAAMILPKEIRSKLSIGISKDYYSDRSQTAFLSLLIYAGHLVREVHLLGWPLPLHHLSGFTMGKLNIRSTDSARAITYAMYGIDLEESPRHHFVYPKRPKDFFDREMTVDQLNLAKKNLEFYYRLCRAPIPAVSLPA